MNEIITFGKQYYILSDGIKVFIKCAKKHCDTLTILGNKLGEEVLEYLKEQNVNYVDVLNISEKYNVNLEISSYTLKVIFFYLYCKNYSKATNVYLCDFEDIYVQKNVFDLIKNNKPYITSENNIISNCQTNYTWINLCYNQDIYNLLKNYEILNGGNILGQKETCVDLLKEICNDMTQIISRIGNYQNIDQASLNKVVRFDSYRYNILNNLEIANMAHLSKSEIEYGDLIKIDDIEPYVIHQYDFNKPLEKHLYEKQN